MPLNTLTFCNITKWMWSIEQSIQIDLLFKKKNQGNISQHILETVTVLRDQKMLDKYNNFSVCFPIS